MVADEVNDNGHNGIINMTVTNINLLSIMQMRSESLHHFGC